MAYKLMITEHADELLDNIVYHLLYRLKNEQAAKHLLDGIENVYKRLEENPQQFSFSRDITPVVKYHNFCLSKDPSAALSSIAVALATAQSSALHMNLYPTQKSCDI